MTNSGDICMKTFNDKKKGQLIQLINEALEKKIFNVAIEYMNELMEEQNDFLYMPSCLEDQIQLMTLRNQVYQHENIDSNPKFFKRELYELILKYKGGDEIWKANVCQSLFSLCFSLYDVRLAYDIFFILAPLYKNQNMRDQLKDAYEVLWKMMKSLELDLQNYASRIDQIELNKSNEAEAYARYQLRKNPLEQADLYKRFETTIDDTVKEEVGHSSGMGFCHVIWSHKKALLKNAYQIDWYSPADLNDALFD